MFKKTFLLANTSIEIVLEISFLSLNNINIKFAELKKLTWRSYTTIEALPTAYQIELIKKRKLAKLALDKNFKTFTMYIAALKATGTDNRIVHLLEITQLAALQ